MIGSDLLIGNPIFVGDQMNRIVLFTYSGFALIALLNFVNRNRLWKGLGKFRLKTVSLLAGLGIGFVLLYDVWTNIGWWYLMYPHDASSFVMVFTAGLPFMIYHMISGAVTFVAIAFPVLVYASKKTQLHLPFNLRLTQKVPVAVVVLGLIALSFTGTALNVPEKSEIWLEKSDQTSVQITIFGDGWTINQKLVAYESDTVLSLLERCGKRNGFTVESTYYAQFDATLIESINGVVNGNNGKYWQYYVNGELPMIGADKCPITNGDSLRWSFEIVPY